MPDANFHTVSDQPGNAAELPSNVEKMLCARPCSPRTILLITVPSFPRQLAPVVDEGVHMICELLTHLIHSQLSWLILHYSTLRNLDRSQYHLDVDHQKLSCDTPSARYDSDGRSD